MAPGGPLSAAKPLPYMRVPPGEALVAGIEIRVVHPISGKPLEPVLAVIDTGSDETTFPAQWLLDLDIQASMIADADVLTGGGVLVAKRLLAGLDIKAVGHKVHIPTVMLSPNPIRPITLGLDFLEHFRFAVDQRSKRFWLMPYDD